MRSRVAEKFAKEFYDTKIVAENFDGTFGLSVRDYCEEILTWMCMNMTVRANGRMYIKLYMI